MASRLSDEAIKSSYESGMRGIAVRRSRKLPDLLGSTTIDIDELLSRETADEDIKEVDPIVMYRAIMAKGPSDCLDLLPFLSTEQVTRIFDYEAWRDDRLEPLRAINWLMLFNELGPTDMFERLKDQEEEFQLALLGPMVELLDEEEFEKVPDHEQDQFVALPCNTLYYRVKTDDARVQQFVQSLVGSGLESDLQYTYSLLSHAAYIPPTEQEAQLAQFRKARLEEDGFVSLEESARLFNRIDTQKLKKRWCSDANTTSKDIVKSESHNTDSVFFVRVLARLSQDIGPDAAFKLQQTMVHTANMICTATGTEAGEEAQMRDILYNMQAMVNLGLEWISRGDLATAVDLIQRIHPQELFRTGVTVVAAIGDDVIESLHGVQLIDAEKMEALWKQDKRGALVHWLEVNHIDFLGFERLELLKGLFNRFPMLVSEGKDELSARKYFQPVITISDLEELKVQAAVFIQELNLFRSACNANVAGKSIDKVLATAIARACIQGAFSDDSFSDAEIRDLAGRSQEQLAQAFAFCTDQISQRLTENLKQLGWDPLSSQVVIDQTIRGLSDLYLSFLAGLRSVGSPGLDGFNPDTLSSMIFLKTQKEPYHHA
jgi:hypothetical protein